MTSFSRAGDYMFIMIRTFQLIIHLAFMKIILPANVMDTLGIMIPIVCFDIIDSKFDWADDQSIISFNTVMQEQLSHNIIG